jgi:Cu+-exporting ATPase
MEFTFSIDGMHCGGCVSRVKKALQPLADEVEVTLEPPRARLVADAPPDLAAVRAAVAGAGRYTVEPASG